MPEDSAIITSILGAFKSVDDKLDRQDDKLEKIFAYQDGMKDKLAEMSTKLAVMEVSTAKNDDCDKKHNECMDKFGLIQNIETKKFWMTELDWKQAGAWCAGIAMILGVLMGALNFETIIKYFIRGN